MQIMEIMQEYGFYDVSTVRYVPSIDWDLIHLLSDKADHHGTI